MCHHSKPGVNWQFGCICQKISALKYKDFWPAGMQSKVCSEQV